MVSASSVRLIRLASEGSDFDIFFDPSRKDMTRVAAPSITGSVMGKKSTLEIVVELGRDVAGQFQMLLLILAHRHMGRVVKQDIRRHQRRIGDKARARRFSAFLPALSLNWVIRFIQPMRATQLKIQASSAWPGTWDWLKRIERLGSSPEAM